MLLLAALACALLLSICSLLQMHGRVSALEHRERIRRERETIEFGRTMLDPAARSVGAPSFSGLTPSEAMPTVEVILPERDAREASDDSDSGGFVAVVDAGDVPPVARTMLSRTWAGQDDQDSVSWDGPDSCVGKIRRRHT